MKETWRDIKGYEGFYKVSDLGRVKRIISKYRKEEKIRNIQYKKNGYAVVMLSVNQKIKLKHVHRLVAESFIENAESKPHINHKDLNKKNNCVYNLEWCTPKENMMHAMNNKNWNNNAIKGEGNLKNKKVYKYNKEGKFIRDYYSITNAAELNNLFSGEISLCCNNIRKSCGGYIWSFKKEKIQNYKRKNDRCVIRTDKKNIKIKYNTIKQAATENKLNSPNIIACCIGKTKSCGGFLWDYE